MTDPARPDDAASDLDDLVGLGMVDVGDVRLHVAEAGPASPDAHLVVLLHGFPEFWYSWRHQIPALAAAGYRVVAPDMRGYHRSDRPHGLAAYRGEALVADVAGLVQAYGAQRATIVGHDWGGVVAWMTALRRPDLVERLVVCNAPHPATFGRMALRPDQVVRSAYMLFFQLPVIPERVLSARRGAAVRRVLGAAATRPGAMSERDLERYAEVYAGPDDLRGPLAYYRWMGRRVTGQALAGLARRLPPRSPAHAGRSRAHRRVTMPTLILWGTDDPVLPFHLADPGEALVPDRRVVPVQGAGHFVQSDAPVRVNDQLLAFLGGPAAG